MAKAIVFDFWGTLVENGTYSPIRQVKRILRLDDMPFSDYVIRLENAMMIKKHESLKDAFEAVANEFGIKINTYQINMLVGLWNKNWLLAKPYPEAEKVLSELKKKYKLIMISNTDNFSVEPVLQKFDFSKYFDKILLSYEQGSLKTDGKMLEHALSEMGIPKEDVVVVGDSMESDIMPAERAGMKAVLVDRKERRTEISLRIKNLEELSLIL
jgi:HAD superfamily hydrolase (TIGR01549 family)